MISQSREFYSDLFEALKELSEQLSLCILEFPINTENHLRLAKKIAYLHLYYENSDVLIIYSNAQLQQFFKQRDNFDMTIESSTSPQSEIVEIVHDQNLDMKNSTLSDNFFYNQKPAKISLFPNFLLLEITENTLEPQYQKLSINFQFGLKAQLIQQQKGKSTSKILGFNLFVFRHQKHEFIICQNQQIYLWIKHLQKKVTLTNFAQHYVPTKPLGSGEYSEVYVVQRKRDKKELAVKKINKRMSYAQINGQESVQNQIQILRSLPLHPNIVKLYAIYESQKSIFILQKLIVGQTLQNFLYQKQYKLQKNQIKKIIKGILEALTVLQKLNIIHRDLKPGNIVIGQDGNPVLIDFGLSVKMTSQKQKFQICGSPGFIAPQIIVQEQQVKISQKSDIFSLGCVFHFMLTNRTLFKGESTDQIFHKNKECSINWGSSYYKDLDELELELLKQMLEQNPENRISPSQALEHCYFKPSKQISQSIDQYIKQNLCQTGKPKDFNFKLKNSSSKFEQLFAQSVQITFINDEMRKTRKFDQENKQNFDKANIKDCAKKLNNNLYRKDQEENVQSLEKNSPFNWGQIRCLTQDFVNLFNFGKKNSKQ